MAQLRRRVELDIYYIENWPFLLDITILILTLPVVIKRTSAYKKCIGLRNMAPFRRQLQSANTCAQCKSLVLSN